MIMKILYLISQYFNKNKSGLGFPKGADTLRGNLQAHSWDFKFYETIYKFGISRNKVDVQEGASKNWPKLTGALKSMTFTLSGF